VYDWVDIDLLAEDLYEMNVWFALTWNAGEWWLKKQSAALADVRIISIEEKKR